jgi:hypothetical protein
MNATLLRHVLRIGIAATVTLTGVSRATAGPAVPTACITKTEILPKEPGWAFVVNFDAFADPTSPRGCLVVWRVANFRPTEYVLTTCKTQGPSGGVVYPGDGKAQFAGGHITCDINIKEMLTSLTPPVPTVNVEFYKFFTIIAPGQLGIRQQGVSSVNTIAHYRPSNPEEPDISLYVSLGSNGGNIASTSNFYTRTGKFLNESILNARQPFTFAMAYDGIIPILTATHYLTDTAIETFNETSPVRFWANGGTVWIGASSTLTNALLTGTFEEFILDPPDGGAPPPPAARNLRYYELFMPVSFFNPP